MRRSLIALALSALVLAACGGSNGGNSGATKLSFTTVTSFGASLTDSGTFGYKFTVQPDEGETYLLWNERVAEAYGVDDTCAVYTATSSTTFTDNSASTGCRNYAIGGSVIQNFTAASDPSDDSVDNTSPLSILEQLTAAAERATDDGGFTSKDLILVGGDSGANDIAAMLTYLYYATNGSTTYAQHFANRVLSILSSDSDAYTAAATALNDSDLATAGYYYMIALADTLAATVQSTVLEAGATHVVVQNTLDVSKTPKFQTILAALDSTTAAEVEAVVDAWLTAYNTELAAQLGDDSRVVVSDFYTYFNKDIANPTQYALTDVTTPVCYAVQTALGSSSPDELSTCTDTMLDTYLPDWRSYLFANSFHPTPYGHQLLAESVTDTLAKAGWL
ncbi:MAG: SGNH/GDSL hydrolase family protein [Solimonas sp.]